MNPIGSQNTAGGAPVYGGTPGAPESVEQPLTDEQLMGLLTEEERRQLEQMIPEQQQAFLQQKRIEQQAVQQVEQVEQPLVPERPTHLEQVERKDARPIPTAPTYQPPPQVQQPQQPAKPPKKQGIQLKVYGYQLPQKIVNAFRKLAKASNVQLASTWLGILIERLLRVEEKKVAATAS